MSGFVLVFCVCACYWFAVGFALVGCLSFVVLLLDIFACDAVWVLVGLLVVWWLVMLWAYY